MRKIVLLTLVLLMISSTCSATFIRMNVEMTSPELVTEDNFKLNISVTNTGDEPAYDVELSLSVPDGFSTNNIYVGTLYPNKPFRSQFDVNVVGAAPGRYPFILKTNYADTNSYPFSTIAPKIIDYKEHAKAATRVRLDSIEVSDDETKDLKLKIINIDPAPHSYVVKLHTPNEISVEPAEQRIDIAASSEQEVNFKVKSFGALPDSSYAVTATIEYEDMSTGVNLHRTFLASSIVSIVKKPSAGEFIPTWIPIALLVLLIGAFAYLQLRRRMRKTKGKKK